MTTLIDQLILKENILYYKDVFGEMHHLPNLTTLHHLYQTSTHTSIQTHIKDILSHDLGTLLVVEIMIDASHEVTLKRLETGEISKNMKHVHDYYVIPKSHFALAKHLFTQANTASYIPFETCHFAMFPFGLVIKRESFSTYRNFYTDASVLHEHL